MHFGITKENLDWFYAARDAETNKLIYGELSDMTAYRKFAIIPNTLRPYTDVLKAKIRTEKELRDIVLKYGKKGNVPWQGVIALNLDCDFFWDHKIESLFISEDTGNFYVKVYCQGDKTGGDQFVPVNKLMADVYCGRSYYQKTGYDDRPGYIRSFELTKCEYMEIFDNIDQMFAELHEPKLSRTVRYTPTIKPNYDYSSLIEETTFKGDTPEYIDWIQSLYEQQVMYRRNGGYDKEILDDNTKTDSTKQTI